ncbi:MAG: hypothetical protein ACLP19_06140 [Xanthobacteraceae bacterium]
MFATLGPVKSKPLFGNQRVFVRIADDMRYSTVFFGYPDSTPGKGGIDCIGTGFFLDYEGGPYFVTAKHLAHEVKSDPFLVRMNKKDGTSDNIAVDGLKWIHHPDPTVDVSVIPFLVPKRAGYETTYIQQKFLMTDQKMSDYDIGVGSLTYTVGLFRLLSGEKRNLPITYMGNIAMLPRDEKIPVVDWTDPNKERIIYVEGYLIAAQSLDGLSGSPVFVRPESNINFAKILTGPGVAEKDVCGLFTQVELLGIWQGSWTAKPDEIRAASQEIGDSITVPVGTGIVVPYSKLIEVLEMDEAKAGRQWFAQQMPAAHVDSVSTRAQKHAPSGEENPQHLKDFTRLVDVAARKRTQDD